MTPARWRTLAIALAIAAAGCASAQQKGILPPDQQFELARKQFDDGDYREAIQSLQTFAFNYPQDPRVADARWLTAEAYYAQEDWATAAQEYLNFQRDFPREDRADDALFKAGVSYQHMSLRPELDQSDTRRAINVFERIPTEYPQSDHVEEARERRARLRDKLAEKVYLDAEFYFDNDEYKASEIYLTDLIEQYPDSSWLPAGYALLARSFCKEGLDERAAKAWSTLRSVYPDSGAESQVRDELSPACRGEAPATAGAE